MYRLSMLTPRIARKIFQLPTSLLTLRQEDENVRVRLHAHKQSVGLVTVGTFTNRMLFIAPSCTRKDAALRNSTYFTYSARGVMLNVRLQSDRVMLGRSSFLRATCSIFDASLDIVGDSPAHPCIRILRLVEVPEGRSARDSRDRRK